MFSRVVLSVEDNDGEFHIIKIALEECGVPVRLCRAVDGEEALSFLQRSRGFENSPRPDLILLNVNMPKKDGIEVLAEIREIESLRAIPVIIFTTSTRAIERKKALALGAEDFISKPASLHALIEVLRSLCSRFLAGD